MNAMFKANENYYPGPQRFSILSDGTFRKCLSVLIPFAVLQIIGSFGLRAGSFREIYFILVFLIYMIPATLSAAGGMPAAGWRRYAAAAALYAAGTIPVSLGGSHVWLAAIPAAVLCFYMAARTAPQTFSALGYGGRFKPATEIILTIFVAGVMVFYTWLGQTLIRKSGVKILPLQEYLRYISLSALYYFAFWGMLQGLLLRRLLDMRYEVSAPISINTAIMSVYWCLSIIGHSNMKAHYLVAGAVMQSIISQTALGMSFYIHRSTRPLLLAYVIYYLFLQSAIF